MRGGGRGPGGGNSHFYLDVRQFFHLLNDPRYLNWFIKSAEKYFLSQNKL